MQALLSVITGEPVKPSEQNLGGSIDPPTVQKSASRIRLLNNPWKPIQTSTYSDLSPILLSVKLHRLIPPIL